MMDRHLFEYAVLRIVPRVEREEFINVGVILYCPKQKFLHCRFTLDENRLAALCAKTDATEIRAYLDAFNKICEGNANAGPIAQLPLAGRFRWLTATRSTILQTSKVHTGLCNDASVMLDHIYQQQVAREE